jgi:hypothetical protein
MHLRQHLDFVGLARPDKQSRIGCLPLASQTRHGLQTGRAGQLGQLVQLAIEMRKTEIDADQHHSPGQGWR